LADKILVLVDSKIEAQGTWDDLQSSGGYLSRIQIEKPCSNYAEDVVDVKGVPQSGAVHIPEPCVSNFPGQTGDLSVYCTA
jgi:hypothetical protein